MEGGGWRDDRDDQHAVDLWDQSVLAGETNRCIIGQSKRMITPRRIAWSTSVAGGEPWPDEVPYIIVLKWRRPK